MDKRKNSITITKERFKAFQNGDENVFEDIFYVNHGKVKSFVSHLVKQDAEAEDITQNVFVKLWTNRAAIRSHESLYAYLYKLARNEALDFFASSNKKSNIVQNLSGYIPESISSECHNAYEAMEMQLLISRIVSYMPEQRRKVFCMSRYDNMSYEEISNALGISKKTIENHINVALKQIRRVIYLFLLARKFQLFFLDHFPPTA